MQTPRTRQRGSAIIMAMLMIVPCCAMVGLVFDVGWAYFSTESARSAADAAALAAVQSAMDSVKSHGGTYTCDLNGVACQAATNCAVTVPSPITNNLQNGCAYAGANGFTNGGLNGAQTVTIEANTTSPPPTVSGVDVQYWVTVRISQQNPLTFLAVLGGKTLNVGVRATAAVIPVAVQDCMVALDPTAHQALTISGGSSVNASNCGVEVASTQNNALTVSGGSTLTAKSIAVAGSSYNCSSSACSPTPTTGATVTNPYSNLSAPTFSTTCTSTQWYQGSNQGTVIPSNTSATLSQGTYCGGINNHGTLTFNSGTYILYGGGFTQSDSHASSSGAGVTFYNTCNPSPCNGTQSNYNAVDITGGSSATLSAPTSGSLAGIVFFQDPTVNTSKQDTISGGSSVNITGALYFPESQLVFSGGSSNASSDVILVAGTITISGSSDIGPNGQNGAGPSAPMDALIE